MLTLDFTAFPTPCRHDFCLCSLLQVTWGFFFDSYLGVRLLDQKSESPPHPPLETINCPGLFTTPELAW